MAVEMTPAQEQEVLRIANTEANYGRDNYKVLAVDTATDGVVCFDNGNRRVYLLPNGNPADLVQLAPFDVKPRTEAVTSEGDNVDPDVGPQPADTPSLDTDESAKKSAKTRARVQGIEDDNPVKPQATKTKSAVAEKLAESKSTKTKAATKDKAK